MESGTIPFLPTNSRLEAIIYRQALSAFSVPDRVNLLSDQWALVQAGRASLQSYFDLIKKLPTSTELAERDQIINAFDSLNQLIVGNPDREPSAD